MRIKQGNTQFFTSLFLSRQAQWPAFALIAGASIWGVIWYPLRKLAALGVSGPLAAALIGLVACCFALLAFRRALRESWQIISTQPAPQGSSYWLLPLLAVAAGMSTVSIIWGMIHGEVMRVLLLFYLSPVWTAFFAHWLLNERITLADTMATLCALTGAALIVWSPELGFPVPSELAEWAGLFAGVGFALQNVLALKISRTLPVQSPQVRTTIVFAGDVLIGFLICAFEWISGTFKQVPLAHPSQAFVLLMGLGILLAANSLLIQYGLARMPANRAALLMLFEIVITAISAWLLADETLGWREISGGGAIVAASLLSSWFQPPQERASHQAVP